MTRILITGGAGFVGTNLAERLLRDGHHVHVVDDFSTGTVANVLRFKGFQRFSWSPCDISSPGALDMVPRGTEQIYNLASRASPKAYTAKPIETLLTSTHGMKAVLDLALSIGARVLQASTSEVYGDPAENPQQESYWGHVNPIGPRSCYDEGKRAAETFCYEYGHLGVQVRIARLFNTYGPWMQPDDGRVVSNFIVQALAGEPLTVYGHGKQTRSLCYIDDTVEGIIRLMDSPVDLPVNIGNPHEITMIQLAAAVLEATGNPRGTIRHEPLPTDDPRQRCPDIARAALALDWKPQVSLYDGLQKTVQYFRGIAP
jgi:UDP-glucuronate decarboxylase